jgi:phage terminase large subunit-like protein
MAVKSRHLIVRQKFNHVKTSIWYDTFPKIWELLYPQYKYKENKSDWFIELPHNGSQFWFGGIDDKQRTEKILGNEYSTILANECSQLSYYAIQMLLTRLAENSGLMLKFFYDMNPPSKKHWSYPMFIQGKHPVDGTILGDNYGSLLMNPKDNEKNIGKGYIEKVLMSMSKREQARFILGQFLDDVEGALWTFDMITQAQNLEFGEAKKTVVGLDPAVTSEAESDNTGIVVCSTDGVIGRVDADYSMKATPLQWAQAAVNAYHKHEAAYIVAEVNQGGDLVDTVIKQIDPKIKVIKVHANKGKFARAEPIAALYEQNKIAHAEGLDALESEMQEYVPMVSKKSPDRIDAMVYALTDLMLKSTPEPSLRII